MKLLKIRSKKNKELFAMVDDSDFEKLSAMIWYYKDSGCYTKIGRTLFSMERFIIKSLGNEVSHVDGNKLNN